MAKKCISSPMWMDSGLFPVNIRLFTLQCGVLGDYFSYQTYLLITRQGCSLFETHALSPLPRGGVVQQQLDYLDELPLITLSMVQFGLQQRSWHTCSFSAEKTEQTLETARWTLVVAAGLNSWLRLGSLPCTKVHLCRQNQIYLFVK